MSSALAEAARTACPNSRRLRATGVSFLRGAGPHDPHPFGAHVPHAVPVLPMTFNIFSIALSPFHAECSVGSWHVTNLLIDRLEGERMARTRLVQSSLMTVLYEGSASDSHPRTLAGCRRFQCTSSPARIELAKLAVTAQHGSSVDVQFLRQANTLPQSEFEDLPPVILERKLDAIIIDVKAVAKVNPPAKQELAPNRDARNGVV